MTGPYTYVPLRRFLEELTDGPFGSSLAGSHYSDDGARVIRLGNIGEARFKSDDEAYIPMEYFAELRRHSVESGDLLIAGLGDSGNPVGRACLAPEGLGPAIVKADCFRARLDERRLLHRFAAWALNSRSVGQQVLTLTRGSTRARINLAAAKAIEIPVPPLEEQCRIVGYLDRETARIDTLIEEQQFLIEMLRERRQAVIDESFSTPGEPSVQLRRYIKFLTSGSRGWGDYYADQGERFLRIGNLPRANLEIRGDIQFVNLPADVTEGSRTMLQEGDLLFSITAYLGSVAVVEGDWVGAYVSQHVALCRLERDQVDPRFIGWFMLTTTGQDQLNEGAAGGTKMQLALDDIRGLRVPRAPIEQQRGIAAHLERQTSKIDTLIAEAELFIELARERRSALITAAVTGQIDVREMA